MVWAELLSTKGITPNVLERITLLSLSGNYVYETVAGEVHVYTLQQAEVTLEGWRLMARQNPKNLMVTH